MISQAKTTLANQGGTVSGSASWAGISPNIQGFYDRNLLERSLPELVWSKFAQIRPLPINSGTTINFRRYNALSTATTALTEGVPGAGQSMTASNINATVKPYGDFVSISDMVQLTTLDPVLAEASNLLGEAMGQTKDLLVRTTCLSGTGVRYGGGVAGRTDVVTAISTNDVQKAVRVLEANNAKKITSLIQAGVNVGTVPVRPSYWAVCHTDMRQDIEALAGFTPVETYAHQSDVQATEIGEAHGVRFLLTTHGGIVADAGGDATANNLVFTSANTACNIYQIVFFARDAYGDCPLSKKSTGMIIKPLGSAGTLDPLNLQSSAGYKFYTASTILQDAWMYRAEVGCSEL